jgi:hypothetical protein
VVDNDPPRRGDFARQLAELLSVRQPRFLPAWTAKFAGVIGTTLARSLRISNDKLRGASSWSPRHANSLEGWRMSTGL